MLCVVKVLVIDRVETLTSLSGLKVAKFLVAAVKETQLELSFSLSRVLCEQGASRCNIPPPTLYSPLSRPKSAKVPGTRYLGARQTPYSMGWAPHALACGVAHQVNRMGIGFGLLD